MKYIVLAGEGAGGGDMGSFCDPFDFPASPAVVGGTLYSDTVQNLRAWENTASSLYNVYPKSDYGRFAQLCISGVPENQIFTIELVSPDGTITLTSSMMAVHNPQYQQQPDIVWLNHPEGRADTYQENENSPIEMKLPLWWAGALPGGIWPAKVIWPGHIIYGEFDANTRQSPEISLMDSRSGNEIFPNVGAASCHLASAQAGPYTILAENFPPNSSLYALVYHGYFNNGRAGATHLELEFEASAHADPMGTAKVDLAHQLISGEFYFILGVSPGVTNLMLDGEGQQKTLSLAAIQNAIDCFQVP